MLSKDPLPRNPNRNPSLYPRARKEKDARGHEMGRACSGATTRRVRVVTSNPPILVPEIRDVIGVPLPHNAHQVVLGVGAVQLVHELRAVIFLPGGEIGADRLSDRGDATVVFPLPLARS